MWLQAAGKMASLVPRLRRRGIQHAERRMEGHVDGRLLADAGWGKGLPNGSVLGEQKAGRWKQDASTKSLSE